MIRINNILIDPDKIIYVLQEEGLRKVRVVFDGGVEAFFENAEAAELWKLLDGEKDWRDD